MYLQPTPMDCRSTSLSLPARLAHRRFALLSAFLVLDGSSHMKSGDAVMWLAVKVEIRIAHRRSGSRSGSYSPSQWLSSGYRDGFPNFSHSIDESIMHAAELPNLDPWNGLVDSVLTRAMQLWPSLDTLQTQGRDKRRRLTVMSQSYVVLQSSSREHKSGCKFRVSLFSKVLKLSQFFLSSLGPTYPRKDASEGSFSRTIRTSAAKRQ